MYFDDIYTVDRIYIYININIRYNGAAKMRENNI